jgi:hypothetical protein
MILLIFVVVFIGPLQITGDLLHFLLDRGEGDFGFLDLVVDSLFLSRIDYDTRKKSDDS